ncbi:hypothetical protein NDU88_003338 [Pleurodeles waltl]|uniref:Uncharacterized protein n=1 Tax=Pleurodeles waltl TaxID=8319 RepID=A0AAV7NKF2_PLEWA|nr:hypothetical protein NDU88_003338 [Pleurodeles waltl]
MGRTKKQQPMQAQMTRDQYSLSGGRGCWGDRHVKPPRDSHVAVEHKVDEMHVDLSLIHQDLRGVTGSVNKVEKPAELDLSLTEDEVDCAILALQAGMTLGPDCYPIEYYQRFHQRLVPHLVSTYGEAVQPGLDCATIVVIPKSDLPRDQCFTYRPILLINVDIKIFAKVLAT